MLCGIIYTERKRKEVNSMLKFVLIFTVCSLVNVMLNTVKTIIMYRNDKLSSAFINSITYGFYVILVVLMAGEMSLWVKVVITAGTNFVGVWLSMCIMDRFHKDKLWEVRVTSSVEDGAEIEKLLINAKIGYTKLQTANHVRVVFNIYCPDQKTSAAVRQILNRFNVKYFVSETKSL